MVIRKACFRYCDCEWEYNASVCDVIACLLIKNSQTLCKPIVRNYIYSPVSRAFIYALGVQILESLSVVSLDNREL